jgi:hypothetical protein
MRTNERTEHEADPAVPDRWGRYAGPLERAGGMVRRPATALVVIGLITLVMGWQFITDSSRAVPALDTAWYQWRAEYIQANDPGSLIEIQGADGSLTGGYRAAQPVLAALVRIVGGVDASVPTVILSIFFRVAAAVALAAFAWRHRRSWLLFYLTLLVVPALFLLQQFFGFMDNFFALALVAAALLLLERMRTSWPARVAVVAMLFLTGLTHPTTLALFLLALGVVAAYHMVREGFSLRAAFRSDVAPMLWGGAVAVVLMFAAWLGGMWGPSAGLNEAAVPPPETVSYFVNRSLNVFRGMQPLTLVPVFVIGLVSVAIGAWRRRERFSEITFAWNLPLLGMFGFVLGAAYPYFRFFNATLAPLLAVAVGLAAIIAFSMRFRTRPLAQVAPVVAVALVAGILFGWWSGGLSGWNSRGTWLTPDVRTTLAAADGYLAAEPEGRNVVFVTEAQPGEVVPYGKYKEFANALYAGLGGERIDDAAVFFGRVEDLAEGRATALGDGPYDRLSADSAEEARPFLDDEADNTVVMMPLEFNEHSDNPAWLDGCGDCREIGDSEVFVLGDLMGPPISEGSMGAGAEAAAEARAFAESPPGPFENLPSTVLSLLGLILLFVVPGWLLHRALPDPDPVEAIALVPMLSATALTTIGVVVLAVLRGPLTPAVGWTIWGLTVAIGLALALLGRPRASAA